MSQVNSGHGWRYWRRMAIWIVIAAAGYVVLFSGATWSTPPRRLIEPFAISLTFTLCIVPIIGVAMPRVVPAVKSRFGFPLDWIIVLVVLSAIALVGSLLAISLLTVAGYIPPRRFGTWFAGSVRVSLIMTLIFGVAGTAFETLRAQLDETTLALRTKERDEAEARRAAAVAQLSSLESRVNPHFLFNTLNSIAALTHNDPAAAERMTSHLASLMRSSLDTSSTPLISIDEELRLVRNYLDIERMRFGDRLQFTIDAGGDVEGAQVPRLALQTLVENSVKYAVAPSREGAQIAVRAQRNEDRIRLTVEDNGPGFDGERIPEGHGLALVKSRLAMNFGDEAALTIESRPGRTVVAIELWRSG